MTTPPETWPIPCSACALCCWRVHCSGHWKQEDSLHLITGIAKGQVAKLEAAGIAAMETLAQHEGRVPKLAEATLEKLRTQARLQHARKEGDPTFVLRPHVPGKGEPPRSRAPQLACAAPRAPPPPPVGFDYSRVLGITVHRWRQSQTVRQ